MRKETVKGYNGADLFVGQNVVYPGRRGSSLWLIEGTITEIGNRPTYSGGFDYVQVRRKARAGYNPKTEGRIVQLTRLDLIVPLT